MLWILFFYTHINENDRKWELFCELYAESMGKFSGNDGGLSKLEKCIYWNNIYFYWIGLSANLCMKFDDLKQENTETKRKEHNW